MAELNGLLVTNRFIANNERFISQNFRYRNSARNKGILLDECFNDELLVSVDLSGIKISLEKKYDFAIFLDKDLRLAQALEKLGVRLFNNSHTIEICDDKSLTAMYLAGSGIEMPQTIISPKTFDNVGYNSTEFLCDVIFKLGFPIVVKESVGSFGEGVFLAKNKDELEKITSNCNKHLIFQKFIAESQGRDIRINIVGGKVAASILRTNQDDFRANFGVESKSEMYIPNEAEVNMALKVCKLMKVDFAGVDILLGKNGPVFCEINSNPHIEKTFSATGVDVSIKILEHIQNSFDISLTFHSEKL
ncbi:MAG: RimK family alpha-L-glutamate ligase [Bacillota bacterium]